MIVVVGGDTQDLFSNDDYNNDNNDRIFRIKKNIDIDLWKHKMKDEDAFFYHVVVVVVVVFFLFH